MVATVPTFGKINLDEEPLSSYLHKQLIAYIGNKRALLPFLARVFTSIDERRPVRTFLDPFAGSGAVARLAKALGYQVHASDWEFYSWVVNSCHVACDGAEAERLFAPEGGLNRVLGELNENGDPGPCYISRHFAPEDTSNADYRRERLFYTRENALFIDRVRNRIEDRYPGWELSPDRSARKTLLVALLLYQAATHANTSGVFKAYHKGFGGHSRDALGRIMAPMRLRAPVLLDGSHPCTASLGEASAFVSGRPADLVYLDPPYNIHQYGSNYFMLNTIARWDRPEVAEERGADGRLLSKAGIRRDWVATRSPYCSRRGAPGALQGLLERIDARHVVLSYNTEGIIPFEQLLDLLSSQGRVELFATDYTVYRGGRQSLQRKTANVEFVLLLERGVRDGSASAVRFRRFRIERQIGTLLRGAFVPRRLTDRFPAQGDLIALESSSGSRFLLATDHCYRVRGLSQSDGAALSRFLGSLSIAELESIHARLRETAVATNREEAAVLLELLDTEQELNGRGAYVRRLLVVMRKFAFKKYDREFREFSGVVADAVRARPVRFPGAEAPLQALIELFERRLAG